MEKFGKEILTTLGVTAISVFPAMGQKTTETTNPNDTIPQSTARLKLAPDKRSLTVSDPQYSEEDEDPLKKIEPPIEPPVVKKVQELMQGFHMEVLPSDFTSMEDFKKKYVQKAKEFYESENGKKLIDLKKEHFRIKEIYCLSELDRLSKDIAFDFAFEPIWFCYNEFTEEPELFTDKQSYVRILEIFLSNLEDKVSSFENEDRLTNEAENIWYSYEYQKKIAEMGGKGADSELDFSEKKKLQIPFKEFENFEFSLIVEFRIQELFYGNVDGISIIPDSSGTYTIYFPRINEGYLILNKVTQDVLDEFLLEVEAEDDFVLAEPADDDEGLVVENRPVKVYRSNEFMKRLIEDGHSLEEIEEFFRDAECKVTVYNEDWETFVKEWRKKNPKKN